MDIGEKLNPTYQINITPMEVTKEKASIREIKQMAKKNLQSVYSFPKSIGSLGIVAIKDTEKRRFILEGIAAIGL